ncbi:hypothetical protein HDU79_007150 [Rhizoclosmatium sp. JEL0117]|nr:hypothetical protein HDU79_007150 [Rhizoclosmatium sp. JEL0117]
MISSATLSTRSTVIVGGGLAGLSAAIEAARCGAAVTVLDKEVRLGGNSAKASSGMNAAPTQAQRNLSIADSLELFQQDTLAAGKHKNDPKLVQILATQSADALAFIESFGVTLDQVSQCGGHSAPRTHRETEVDGKPKAVGWDIMKALQTYIATLAPSTSTSDSSYATANQVPNTIKVITDARVTELLGDRGIRVTGLQFDHASKCHLMHADSVILATGGYAADTNALIQQYAPQYAKLATTNGPWATGDGVKLGMEFGAKVQDLGQVQIHPTGFVDPKDVGAAVKILAPESLRAYGALLIDTQTSSRFVNELSTRDAVSTAMLNLSSSNKKSDSGTLETPPPILMLMNRFVVESYGEAAIGFYVKRGLVQKFESLKKAAEAYSLDSLKLKREVVTVEVPDRFGKSHIPVHFTGDEVIYAALVTPVRHYTMGGLKISAEAQAMTEAHEPIANLFVCGEAASGLDGWNRLAGNSLLGSVIFGRIAGRSSCH